MKNAASLEAVYIYIYIYIANTLKEYLGNIRTFKTYMFFSYEF